MIKIRWYGTATMEYISDEGRLLIDPFVPLSGSDHQVDITAYDNFTDILVTHGHFDHIENLPGIVRNNPFVKIFCTQTPYNTLLNKGVGKDNLILIHFGEKLQVSGFSIFVYHGRHAVLPKASLSILYKIFRAGNLKNLPFIIHENHICVENDETVMYLIEADEKKILHMGSLNLRDDIDYPVGCDLLMLPYNGWEDNLPPSEAIIERLKPKKVLLHHFDNTFPPVTSDLDLKPVLDNFPGLIKVPEYAKIVEV